MDNEAHIEKKSLRKLIPNADEDAIDLLSKLFTYDPHKRLTAKEMI